jgi:hypothetical protein
MAKARSRDVGVWGSPLDVGGVEGREKGELVVVLDSICRQDAL